MREKKVFIVLISLIFLSLLIFFTSRIYAIPIDCYCVGSEAWCGVSCTEVGDISACGECDCTELENGNYYKCCNDTRVDLWDADCCTDDSATCTPACGPSFSSSSQGYGSTSLSCTDSCGFEDSRTCYCYQCSVASCPSNYSTSSQGYGSLIYDTCTNGCGVGNSRTCYCYDCLKTCPLPLLNQNPANSNLVLEDFRRCTNNCNVGPNESNDDCYEVESPQPEETFSIVDPGNIANPPNDYDFKSITHTGQYDTITQNLTKQGDLNDAISPITMVATYKDTLASDIEGLFVWFQKDTYTSDPDTPVLISNTAPAKTSGTDSWGFMLRRIGTSWIPYVPSDGTSDYWTEFPDTPTPPLSYPFTFYISGPGGLKMVEVTILKQPSQTLQEVTIEFSLRFTNSGNAFVSGSKASEGKYKIWLMGLDKFSFTPFDNYDTLPNKIDFNTFWDATYLLNGKNFTHYWANNKLRYSANQGYAKDWKDTGKTWTLDFADPTFTSFTKEIRENNIIISWDVKDDMNLYAVVGNIYVDGENQEPLTLFNNTSGVTLRGNQIDPLGPDDTNTLIGKLIKDDINSRTWSFVVGPNINSDRNTGSVTIGIGENTVGNISIYLTVFDDAGNVTVRSLTENLADRILTGGGLAFSSGGTTFAQLSLPNTSVWTNILPPYSSSVSAGLVKTNAGLTSEMLANYSSSDLENRIQANSYRLTGHSNWVNTSTTPLYESLTKKYELHKRYIELDLYEYTHPAGIDLSNIVVSNPSICGTKNYCTFFVKGNLGVSNVRCNKRTLIFVQGSLTITPPIESDNAGALSNINGCIFVVGGTVTINSGTNNAGTFEYEKINAFIVSDGVITINHQNQAIVDGVYINGGLISRGGVDSIDILRYLRLEERLVYPVLAIDLHPKYGILAEQFFGNSYVIQSTEVGLKPY